MCGVREFLAYTHRGGNGRSAHSFAVHLITIATLIRQSDINDRESFHFPSFFYSLSVLSFRRSKIFSNIKIIFFAYVRNKQQQNMCHLHYDKKCRKNLQTIEIPTFFYIVSIDRCSLLSGQSVDFEIPRFRVRFPLAAPLVAPLTWMLASPHLIYIKRAPGTVFFLLLL